MTGPRGVAILRRFRGWAALSRAGAAGGFQGFFKEPTGGLRTGPRRMSGMDNDMKKDILDVRKVIE